MLPYEEFLERVQGRSGLDRFAAERAIEAVLETLAARIAGGEVDDIAEGVSHEAALDHAHAVFETLREALPDKELSSDLLAQLPRGYAEALL